MSSPPGAAHLNYSMGVLVSLGGLMGYIKKRSVPSLAAGIAFGGLYAYSGYLITQNSDAGHDLATVTSIILAASMGRRALRGGKFMPAGLITSLAVIAGGYNGMKSYQQRYGV